jgi:hypothetical protein
VVDIGNIETHELQFSHMLAHICTDLHMDAIF